MRIFRRLFELGFLYIIVSTYFLFTHGTLEEFLSYSSYELDKVITNYVFIFFGWLLIMPGIQKLFPDIFDNANNTDRIKDIPYLGSFLETSIWTLSITPALIILFAILFLVMYKLFGIDISFVRGDFLLLVFFMSFLGIFIIWLIRDIYFSRRNKY